MFVLGAAPGRHDVDPKVGGSWDVACKASLGFLSTVTVVIVTIVTASHDPLSI